MSIDESSEILSHIKQSPTKDSYLIAVGKITMNFSQLESTMCTCIGELIGDDRLANIRITAGEPFRNLLRLLSVLFRYRITDKTLLKMLGFIIKDLEHVNIERGNLIHGALYISDTLNDARMIKHKYSKDDLRNFTMDSKRSSLEELERSAENIERIRIRLDKFISANKELIRLHKIKALQKEQMREATIRIRQTKGVQ